MEEDDRKQIVLIMASKYKKVYPVPCMQVCMLSPGPHVDSMYSSGVSSDR